MKQQPWIQTYTGRQFFPLDPRAEDVCIEDIAHALSLKCRFGGMCVTFYSVAEHSTRVCDVAMTLHKECDDQAMAGLMALLHDAAEAYLPDVASPIKHNVWINPGATPGEGDDIWSNTFQQHEHEVHRVILTGLGLIGSTVGTEQPPNFEAVKAADLILLATERRDLMLDSEHKWNLPLKPLDETITPMTPEQAESQFLRCYRDLRRRLASQQQRAAAS